MKFIVVIIQERVAKDLREWRLLADWLPEGLTLETLPDGAVIMATVGVASSYFYINVPSVMCEYVIVYVT